MHGLVTLDAAGEPLRRCILWNDQRMAAQCEYITNSIGGQRLLELTLNPVFPGFTAPKIIWTRENEPEVYAQIAKVLLPKDYIRYRLTGDYATEVSDASGTLALRCGPTAVGSKTVLDEAQHPPRVVDAASASSRQKSPATSPARWPKYRLARGPAGGGRRGRPGGQCCGHRHRRAGAGLGDDGHVGRGLLLDPGQAGTATPEGRLHAFCHAVPGKWHAMGVTLSAGGSLRWFRDTLGMCEKDLALRA